MKRFNLRKSHLSLIARNQVHSSVRGGAGVIFLVLALLVGLLCAGIYISFIEEINKNVSKNAEFQQLEGGPSGEVLVDKFVDKYGYKVVHWMVKDEPSSERLARYLVEKPAVVSAFLLTFLLFLPFLVALAAFNQTAGDIGNRGLRYQLLRTERSNIFLGRFIGTYLFTAFVLVVLMAVVWLYMLLKFRMYSAGEVSLWMVRGTFAVLLFALPYTALCAWFSTFVGSSFGSLSICYGIVGVYPLLVTIFQRRNELADYAWYGVPWGFKYWLLHPSIEFFFLGVVAMLGFTAVFLFLGLHHFHKRDL